MGRKCHLPCRYNDDTSGCTGGTSTISSFTVTGGKHYYIVTQPFNTTATTNVAITISGSLNP